LDNVADWSRDWAKALSVLNVVVMSAKIGTNQGIALTDTGCWILDNYGLRITDYEMIQALD